MSREAHVRFCEGPQVKFLRSTHPYIPMKRGFVYLFAVMDWASRRVLSWRMSNTLTTDFCIEAVQEAISRYGRPDIFNTDQGCQFTSLEFTGLLKDNGIQVSMDGKAAGGTMCSWNDYGGALNTKRSTCELTTASVSPRADWGNTSPDITSSPFAVSFFWAASSAESRIGSNSRAPTSRNSRKMERSRVFPVRVMRSSAPDRIRQSRGRSHKNAKKPRAAKEMRASRKTALFCGTEKFVSASRRKEISLMPHRLLLRRVPLPSPAVADLAHVFRLARV